MPRVLRALPERAGGRLSPYRWMANNTLAICDVFGSTVSDPPWVLHPKVISMARPAIGRCRVQDCVGTRSTLGFCGGALAHHLRRLPELAVEHGPPGQNSAN